jgi:transcription termination factor Rho
VSVLQREELEASPLADLHAIASELGLEGYRSLRKADLIGAILEAQGGDEGGQATEAGLADAVEDEPEVTEAGGPADEEPGAGEEPEAEEPAEPPAAEAEEAPVEEAPADVEEPPAEERPAEPPAEERPAEPPAEERPAEPPAEETLVAGMLDILPNGSGFVRVTVSGQSRDDVYVSPAQIRRCELRAGDAVHGPVRPPRRNERHPSLIRVETVNGRPAEPPEERPAFADLTPVFPTESLEGPAVLEGVPFGRGSRVAIGGAPGAGATTLLREVAATLAERHPEIDLAVVLVGARPEEVTDWRRALSVPVYGGSFETSTEAQTQAAELAVERAKRTVERGGHAALVVDSLAALPPAAGRRVFGAARNTEEGGSLTILAATGTAPEPQRFASSRVTLDAPDGGPRVSAAESLTLRAELLG